MKDNNFHKCKRTAEEKLIRWLMKEEKGKNIDLKDNANNVFNLIIKNLYFNKKTNPQRFELSVYYNIFGIDIKINVNIYNFNSIEEESDFLNKNRLECYFDADNKLLLIQDSTINKNIKPKELYNIVKHEVGHIFQFSKTNGYLISDKNSELYNDAINDHENEMIECIYDCLYFSEKNEIDAFIQVLFSDMEFDNYVDFDTTLENSDIKYYIDRLEYISNMYKIYNSKEAKEGKIDNKEYYMFLGMLHFFDSKGHNSLSLIKQMLKAYKYTNERLNRAKEYFKIKQKEIYGENKPNAISESSCKRKVIKNAVIRNGKHIINNYIKHEYIN